MAKRNFSSKRNAIYKAVCDTKTHPGARWIYDKLKPEMPDLSLATVYRNIAVFKEENMVNVVCSVNGEERIDSNTTAHPHFVCSCCGGVYDINTNDNAHNCQTEILDNGFRADKKFVLYHGICPKCSSTDCTN